MSERPRLRRAGVAAGRTPRRDAARVARLRVLRQLRRRGDRGRDQAGPAGDRPAGDHRLRGWLSRPDVRRPERHHIEPQLPGRPRAAAARCPPPAATRWRTASTVATKLPRPPRRWAPSTTSCATSLEPGACRGLPDRARSGRGRLRPGAGRVPPGPAGAGATRTGSCSSPTRSSRATGGPGGCGASSTRGSSRTWSAWPRASPTACRSGAIVARRELHERWGNGAHGSTFGGNPVSCAAGSRSSRRSRRRGWSRMRRRAASSCAAAFGRSPTATPGSATSAGRGLMIGVELVRDPGESRARRRPGGRAHRRAAPTPASCS